MKNKLLLLFIFIIALNPAFGQYWNSISNTADINNTNTGNVGIGTQPTEKLTVQGNIKLGEGATSLYNFNILTAAGSALVNSGNGRNLIITAGSSDNQAGKLGGSLYLRPGSPTSPATQYGNVYLADQGGNVGIGTSDIGLNSNPNGYRLAVNGKIGAKEIQVENTSSTWADYVFDSTYNLPTLPEVETFIKTNKHLPGIPSKSEIEQHGHKLGEMDVLLLKKLEELTLYLIELRKENISLKLHNEELQKQNAELGKRVLSLEDRFNPIK